MASSQLDAFTHPAEKEPCISLLDLTRTLVPGGVGLTPIRRRPASVKVVERAIVFLQPLLKLRPGAGVEGNLGIFVVDLPAEYVWIMPKTMCHLFGDLACELPILGVGPVELLAIAMLHDPAVFRCAKSLRVFLCKPGRRGGRRRANHCVDLVFCRQGDGTVQPIEVVVAFL